MINNKPIKLIVELLHDYLINYEKLTEEDKEIIRSALKMCIKTDE